MPDKILVFIPTFNDFSELDQLISDIKQQIPKCNILIIDDGSFMLYKPTQALFHVRIPFNLGLGVATHIAMDFVLRHNYQYLVRMDADGQHCVKDIKAILSMLSDNNDIVIGHRTNRHANKGLKTLLKKILHNYFYYLAKFTTSQKIPTDLNSGFLGFNFRAVKAINNIELERYPEPQIILFGADLKLKLAEVPITQKPRRKGISTIAYWQTLRLLFRFTMYSFLLLIRKPIL